LKEHKQNIAKLNKYTLERENLEFEIRHQTQIYSENEKETIEGMTFNKPIQEAISKSKKTDKVSNIALNYKKEAKKKLNIEEMKERIRQLYSILFSIELKIKFVNKVMLTCLTKKEKFIIEQLLIENMNWANVKYSYNEFYRESVETETLRTIKKGALKKIQAVIQETENYL